MCLSCNALLKVLVAFQSLRRVNCTSIKHHRVVQIQKNQAQQVRLLICCCAFDGHKFFLLHCEYDFFLSGNVSYKMLKHYRTFIAIMTKGWLIVKLILFASCCFSSRGFIAFFSVNYFFLVLL